MSCLLTVDGVNHNLSTAQGDFARVLHRFEFLFLGIKIDEAESLRLAFGIFYECNLLASDPRDGLQLFLQVLLCDGKWKVADKNSRFQSGQRLWSSINFKLWQF